MGKLTSDMLDKSYGELDLSKSKLAELLDAIGAVDEIRKLPKPQAEILTIVYDWLHNLEDRVKALEKK